MKVKKRQFQFNERRAARNLHTRTMLWRAVTRRRCHTGIAALRIFSEWLDAPGLPNKLHLLNSSDLRHSWLDPLDSLRARPTAGLHSVKTAIVTILFGAAELTDLHGWSELVQAPVFRFLSLLRNSGVRDRGHAFVVIPPPFLRSQ